MRNGRLSFRRTRAAGRFRVSSSLNARLFAEAIGADVIPLGFGEIVSSLQTGLIEAGENAVSLYARTGISDESPHFSLTKHAFGMSVIVTGRNWWNRLSDDQRRILEESFPTIQESRRVTRAQEKLDLEDPGSGDCRPRTHSGTEAKVAKRVGGCNGSAASDNRRPFA